MAELINCSLCGKEISSRAKACPHCGDPAKGVIKKSLSKSKVNTIAHAVRKGWLVKSTSGNRMAKTFYDKLDEEDPKPVRKRDKWDTSIAIFIMLVMFCIGGIYVFSIFASFLEGISASH